MNIKLHLVILYEDRAKWINRIEKKFYNLESQRIRQLSEFLVNPNDIKELYNGIKNINQDVTIELLEMTEFKSVAKKIDKIDKEKLLIWNITDGRSKYKGSYIPAYASLLNIKFFGNNEFSQMMAQDKYKMYTLCEKLKINTPKTSLYKNNKVYNIEDVQNSKYLFVKGNSLDNNISIYKDSKCNSIDEAMVLSKEISNCFDDDVVIQEYIEGYDIRVQYVNIDNRDIEDSISIYKVNKTDLNGNNIEYISEENKNTHNEEYIYVKNNDSFLEINKQVFEIVKKLTLYFELKDYFAIDLRVSKGKVYFIELNTAPFLTMKRYRNYFEIVYNIDYHIGIYKSIINSCITQD